MSTLNKTAKQDVEAAFLAAEIPVLSIVERSFPGETIVVVEVGARYEDAVSLAARLDSKIENGFVTIKRSSLALEKSERVSSIRDERVSRLIELLRARSRTSEAQPSLTYVPDAEARIDVAVTARHQLIFGRRGVGKTALLLEARTRVEQRGDFAIWTNIQPLRGLSAAEAFLTIAARICTLVKQHPSDNPKIQSRDIARGLGEAINVQLNASRTPAPTSVATFVPRVHEVVSMFTSELGRALFLFLDDVHYMAASEVPHLLDLLHSISRDSAVWLKIAGIRHQTRWFISDPPTGLQTGHDASILDLDITLEEPKRARAFLSSIWKRFVEQANAAPWRGFLSQDALDRIVLASGGVPRDFLELAAASIERARKRAKARTTGVQDVNAAAGEAAHVKQTELEEDAASNVASARGIMAALQDVRTFLIEEKEFTYCRIDFADKERHAREYEWIQSLMDLRMLHLISSSVSDPHEAGRRSEVYLLDLSQYSGHRLKQKIHVLDFQKDSLVLRRTGTKEREEHGNSSLKMVAIMRKGPLYQLSRLSGVGRST